MSIPFSGAVAVVIFLLGLGTCFDAAATAEPDIVYLNRCAAGCTVHSGTDDAINGSSTIPSTSVTLAAFPYSDAVFFATAACVRSVLAPYNVQVRITSPGAVARREIMLTATTSQQVMNVSGIPAASPLDGHPHDNTIAFVFAVAAGSTVDALCAWTAIDIGNLYGLDFVTYCPDIMSSSIGCGVKAFTNQNATCLGSQGTAGVCVLGNTTQNSAAILTTTPGPSDILFENGVENFQVPASGPSP